ncbi:MAG: helix-turn-helix domain-containing protein [Patescibacteria group bacterium]|nr:helix-turn-helix domain-containing protein [Patescibacteria group bacterium]
MPHREDHYHYLPVNDAAMRWGAYITGAGRATIAAGQPYPPQGHPGLYDFQWPRGRVLPEFQVLLITDGQGAFESEPTGELQVPNGSLVFLFPGVWHRYRPDTSTGWTERWISLNGELVHRLLELNVLRPGEAVRQPRATKSLGHAFDQLLACIHEAPNQNSILLSLRGLALLGMALEAASESRARHAGGHTVRTRDVRDPLVAEALDLIWTHSHRTLGVGQIADRLAVSRRAMERHFRSELGHTVLDEINACRLSRAKRLLRETDLGVKAVASLAGFSSEERMRVAFLEAERLAPSEYRRRAIQRRKPRSGRPSGS